jgi:lauroyl/myristoyl acyltransferase
MENTERIMQAYGRRYHRFLSVLRQTARYLPPRYGYPFAARLARYFSPHRDPAICGHVHHIAQQCVAHLSHSPPQVWHSMLNHIGVSHLNIFRIAQLDQDWLAQSVTIHCDFDIKETLKNRGLFLMTYHNHHNFLFTVAIGLLLKHRIRTLAMSPEISPIYPYISDIYQNYFTDCERFYHGGEFLYVKENTSPQSVRAVSKTLKAGDIVISLNDIFNPYAEKRTRHFDFLGQPLPCPVGTVELAIRTGAAMAAGSIRWLGGERFELTLFALPTEQGVDAVMSAYLAGLHRLITLDAGVWEGWRLWRVP